MFLIADLKSNEKGVSFIEYQSVFENSFQPSARPNLRYICLSSGVTSMYATLPADKNYYKLYVTKTMEIRPYANYRAKTGTENWELYNSGAVSIPYSISLSRVKV